MNLPCIFECGTRDKYPVIKEHMQKCLKRVFYCKLCEFSGIKSDLKTHFVDLHEKEFMLLMDNFDDINSKVLKCTLKEDVGIIYEETKGILTN